MELVEGNDLHALVKKNGPFPVQKAVNYILQAAKGLEAAHRKGIVHRDIKPANLLLDSEGTVKILDMGLARISSGDDAATQAELTGTGAVLGTVDYMAPEQARDSALADVRSDIYGMGCTFYHMLAGRPPFSEGGLAERIYKHIVTDPPDVREFAPEVPVTLWTVLRRLRPVAGGAEQCQALFDHFCSDMDANLREMGVGDLTVPKRMHKFGEAFYGRSAAYDAALDAGGEALAQSLCKNILDGRGIEQARKLAAYANAVIAVLAGLDDTAVGNASWQFPSPAPFAAIG